MHACVDELQLLTYIKQQSMAAVWLGLVLLAVTNTPLARNVAESWERLAIYSQASQASQATFPAEEASAAAPGSVAPPLLICGAGGRWRFYATAWDMTCEQNLTVKHGKIEGKDFQTVHPL